MQLIGIDTGGTFTDFVHYDGQKLTTLKVRSTPDHPEQAIIQGLKALGLFGVRLRIVHGSTVATNAILEGKGAKTVYVTNRGLKDVLTIGRQSRAELYNLQPEPEAPPVEEAYLLETGGRLGAQGEVIEPLSEDDLVVLNKEVEKLNPESIAINLIFSFLDPVFEKMIESALSKHYFVTRSSSILREYKEYERGITTWLNSYVGPLVQRYLHRLNTEITDSSISVMCSSGETCGVLQAGREAVHLLLSGPAGGLAGAQFLAENLDQDRLITLDMGGTSTDVALIDGQIQLRNSGKIGKYPVAVPMVDMHTIGAGGGSIAYVDEGGGLQVGPQSAGAMPGPVCYDNGGKAPTVTDANLVLGRLPKNCSLADGLKLNYEKAYKSLSALARKLDSNSTEAVAKGIIDLANEEMLKALKVISIQRGYDPRDFVLLAFGGAGGLHLCDLAEALEITQAIAPNQAGVLSALGMLVAPHGRQFSRTLNKGLFDLTDDQVNRVIGVLAEDAYAALLEEGLKRSDLTMQASIDLCYRGQGSTLNLSWNNIREAEILFHQLHKKRYGHVLESAVQLINVRVGLRTTRRKIKLPEIRFEKKGINTTSEVYGYHDTVPVLSRGQLPLNQSNVGPLIICDDESTTYVPESWSCRRDLYGNLHLSRETLK